MKSKLTICYIAGEWEGQFVELGYTAAQIQDLACKGLLMDTDFVERKLAEELYATILAHTPNPSPTRPPLPSLPYHTHVLRRAAHALASQSLSLHYIAPFGGSRDSAQTHLDRLTSGPPAARPPLIFLSGPPHSGRSSSLAHFHRNSHRCTAKTRLDHDISARPVFPHQGRSNDTSVLDSNTGQSVVVCAFVGTGIGALRETLDFVALEIALQIRGIEALGAGNADDKARNVGHLLSISEEELIEDAMVAFSVSAGCSNPGCSLTIQP